MSESKTKFRTVNIPEQLHDRLKKLSIVMKRCPLNEILEVILEVGLEKIEPQIEFELLSKKQKNE